MPTARRGMGRSLPIEMAEVCDRGAIYRWLTVEDKALEPPWSVGLARAEELAELRDGEGVGLAALEAADRGGFEHGVYDGLFGGVDGGFKQWRESIFAG